MDTQSPVVPLVEREVSLDSGRNVLDVHMARLRRKLDEGFEKPLLHTVRGAGYMLAA